MKSLVIDDDASSRALFVRCLEKYGDCDTASIGFDGINKFREAFKSAEPYDLVVIDIILPDINGNEVLKMIRTEEDMSRTPDYFRTGIILTTSLDDNENRKLSEELTPGKEVYYVKSYGANGLNEKLQELGLPKY